MLQSFELTHCRREIGKIIVLKVKSFDESVGIEENGRNRVKSLASEIKLIPSLPRGRTLLPLQSTSAIYLYILGGRTHRNVTDTFGMMCNHLCTLVGPAELSTFFIVCLLLPPVIVVIVFCFIMYHRLAMSVLQVLVVIVCQVTRSIGESACRDIVLMPDMTMMMLIVVLT